jgi:hypothetical protein
MKNRIATDQHQMLVIHFSHLNKTYTLQEIEDLLGFLEQLQREVLNLDPKIYIRV